MVSVALAAAAMAAGDKALALDRAQFMKHGSAGFMSQLTHTTEMLASGITAVYGGLITEPLKIAACLAGAMCISWQLTLACLAVAPVVICLEIIATIAFSLLLSRRWRKAVFVLLHLEKRELYVETKEDYVELNQILRDREANDAAANATFDPLEPQSNSSVAQTALMAACLARGESEIVNAARENKAHVVGLSILSGSHLPLVKDVISRLKEAGIEDVPVVVGGIIPPEDAEQLERAGVAAVYTPKDFELNRIMSDVVGIVERKAEDAGAR